MYYSGKEVVDLVLALVARGDEDRAQTASLRVEFMQTVEKCLRYQMMYGLPGPVDAALRVLKQNGETSALALLESARATAYEWVVEWAYRTGEWRTMLELGPHSEHRRQRVAEEARVSGIAALEALAGIR